jgi:hypothetical protein
MKRRRQGESGFAMLLVFAMAASVAVMLYMELPRAAFEAQRQKEELLMDRGEQYIRGIQLYVAQWKSYPPTLEALEKTNGKRYLRRRYKDPMTGKDEWRAVHANAAGILVDSIVQKQGQQEEKKTQQTFISELPSIGSSAGMGGDAAQNIGLRRRPSDQNPMPGMGGGPTPPIDPQSLGNGAQVMQPGVPAQSGIPPQQPGMPPQQPGMPQEMGGMPPNGGQLFNPGQQPNPGQPNPMNPNQPAGGNPGLPYPVPAPPGGPQQMQQQQMPGIPGVPNPMGTPGVGGFPTTGAAQPGGPGAPANPGLAMINQILTTPRGNMNMQVPGAPGLQIGGGIAGFASTAEAPSIKLYNERQKYNEWEFIYDVKKDKRLLGTATRSAVHPSVARWGPSRLATEGRFPTRWSRSLPRPPADAGSSGEPLQVRGRRLPHCRNIAKEPHASGVDIDAELACASFQSRRAPLEDVEHERMQQFMNACIHGDERYTMPVRVIECDRAEMPALPCRGDARNTSPTIPFRREALRDHHIERAVAKAGEHGFIARRTADLARAGSDAEVDAATIEIIDGFLPDPGPVVLALRRPSRSRVKQ